MVGEAQRSRAPIQRLADAVRRLLRAGGGRRRGAHLRGLVAARPRAAPRARAGQRRRRADHRLPVRARAGDADVDHGRHRPRRAGGRADQDAEALEVLEQVDTLVVDKTGTLTEGKPRLRDASIAADGVRRERAAAPRRRRSSGAASIRWPRRSSRGARERGLAAAPPRATSTPITGKGVRGTVDGRTRRARQRALARRARHRRRRARRRRAEALRSEGQTVMFVAVDGRVAGPARRSPIRSRPSTPEAIRAAARRRRAHRHADRRQSRHREGRGARSSASTRSRPRCCRRTRAPRVRAPAGRRPQRRHGRRRHQRRAGAGRRPTSASPWAPAPTWPWRAPASRW